MSDQTPWPDNPNDPNNVDLQEWLKRRIDGER